MTVPLYGKKAAGRVALVDDGDYDLVMQYRWRVHEQPHAPGRKPSGPYAIASMPRPGDGSHEKNILMHVLIMGFTGIDHENGNGLDNRRANLRPATRSQNKANTSRYSGRIPGSSGFKGVYWRERDKRWHAQIRVNGRGITLGYFHDEIQAARAYDAAAREHFGEFARTNFQDEPTAAMEARWQAERESRTTEQRQAHSAFMSERWKQRETETRICAVCGAEYQSKAENSRYCSRRCRSKAAWPTEQLRRQRRREQEQAGRLFLGARDLDRRQ
jgi:AP2 domain-containing protein